MARRAGEKRKRTVGAAPSEGGTTTGGGTAGSRSDDSEGATARDGGESASDGEGGGDGAAHEGGEGGSEGGASGESGGGGGPGAAQRQGAAWGAMRSMWRGVATMARAAMAYIGGEKRKRPEDGDEDDRARPRATGRPQGEMGRWLTRTYLQPPTLHLTLLSYMSHSVVDVRVVDTDQCVRPCYAVLSGLCDLCIRGLFLD